MFIHEMTETECREALRAAGMGRIACASNNQPYIVPITFAIDQEFIYSFATFGQKIEWMRKNPKVCLETDEHKGHQQWQSVVVFGRYEELADLPDYQPARLHAYSLISERVMWWEPAAISAAHRDTPHSVIPILYRIRIERMSGHRATPDPSDTITELAHRRTGWWSHVFHYRP